MRHLTAFALILLIWLPVMSANGEDTGCDRAAERWIRQLDDADDADLLRRHTRTNCRFSGEWVKKDRAIEDPARRERLCNDLVLIWTHKNCGK